MTSTFRQTSSFDPEELARSLEELTDRIEADFFDVTAWREMAQLFRLCPDPDEAVRGWALMAPATLIDDRAGAAIARFWTASYYIPLDQRDPLTERFLQIARNAADELRTFIDSGSAQVTVLHWRAMAWTLVLLGEREEAELALDMMRRIALDPDSELPLHVRMDVLRSMSAAWRQMGQRKESMSGWRALASLLHESGQEFSELSISWRHLVYDIGILGDEAATIAIYPFALESALHMNPRERGREPDWRGAARRIINRAIVLGEAPPWPADDASAPFSLPAALEACDRIESLIPDSGGRAAVFASELGWARLVLGDDEGAQRAWETAAELRRLRAAARDDESQVHYELARALALTGSHDEALDALERAIDRGLSGRSTILREIDFASLHDNERFQSLVERADQAILMRNQFPPRLR